MIPYKTWEEIFLSLSSFVVTLGVKGDLISSEISGISLFWKYDDD